MEANQIKSRLQAMQGRKYLRQGKPEKIVDYQVMEGTQTVRIHTTNRVHEKPMQDIDIFLNTFLPVDKPERALPLQQASAPMPKVTAPKSEIVSQRQIVSDLAQEVYRNSGIADLQTLIRENITKVQENKDFIPQATAIKDQVDTFINLTKTQIEFLKVMQGK